MPYYFNSIFPTLSEKLKVSLLSNRAQGGKLFNIGGIKGKNEQEALTAHRLDDYATALSADSGTLPDLFHRTGGFRRRPECHQELSRRGVRLVLSAPRTRHLSADPLPRLFPLRLYPPRRRPPAVLLLPVGQHDVHGGTRGGYSLLLALRVDDLRDRCACAIARRHTGLGRQLLLIPLGTRPVGLLPRALGRLCLHDSCSEAQQAEILGGLPRALKAAHRRNSGAAH